MNRIQKILTGVIFLSLVACGLNARLDGVALIGKSGIVPTSSSMSGSKVGKVVIAEGECDKISYKLKNDYNGYFKVNNEGHIILAKDNPPPGEYELIVSTNCDGETKEIPFPFVIEAPWIVQLGTQKVIPGGGVSDRSLYDNCRGVAVDAQGYVYCAGATRSSLAEPNAGREDIFLMKVAPDQSIVWVKQFGQNTKAFPGADHSRNDSCRNIALDQAGNIYCSGWTQRAVGEASANNRRDGFVMKLDTDGNVIWVTQLGATTVVTPTVVPPTVVPPGGVNNNHHDTCMGIAIDHNGNVFCSGATQSHLGGANSGGSDAYILKLNPSGAPLWARQVGTANGEGCRRMTVDNAGNSYCVGNTGGSLGELHNGAGDIFVMKVDPSGALQWVRQLGALTKAYAGADHTQNEVGTDITVDPSGNIYFSGNTSGSLGEGNGGGEDIFLGKLDPSGNLLWVTQLGDTTKGFPGGDNTANDRVWGINSDSSGNIFMTGQTEGALGEANGGGTDLFVMKVRPTGDIDWVRQFGAVTKAFPGADHSLDGLGEDIAFDSQGRIYVSGKTKEALGEPNAGDYDAFIVRLNPDGSL